MNKRQVEKLIKDANTLASSEAVYVVIEGVDYVLGEVVLHSGTAIGPKSEGIPLYMCVIFATFNDESNSRECDMIVTPEWLQKALQTHREQPTLQDLLNEAKEQKTNG